jgi:hypothetical protein
MQRKSKIDCLNCCFRILQKMAAKKILILNGHPDKESYNYALAEAYFKGAIGIRSRCSNHTYSGFTF